MHMLYSYVCQQYDLSDEGYNSKVSPNILGQCWIVGEWQQELDLGIYQEEITYFPSHLIDALVSGLEWGHSWGSALEMIKASTFFIHQSELSSAMGSSWFAY